MDRTEESKQRVYGQEAFHTTGKEQKSDKKQVQMTGKESMRKGLNGHGQGF